MQVPATPAPDFGAQLVEWWARDRERRAALRQRIFLDQPKDGASWLLFRIEAGLEGL